MIIPNALASHDSEKEWGTVSVDKSVLELPYTTASNAQYEKIKIFGTVEEPRSAVWVYMTVTGSAVSVSISCDLGFALTSMVTVPI